MHISLMRFKVAIFPILAILQSGCVAVVPFLHPDVALAPDGTVLQSAKGCPVSGIGQLPQAVASVDGAEDEAIKLSFFAPMPASAAVESPRVKAPAPKVVPRKPSREELSARRLSILVQQLRDRSDVVRTHAASDLGRLGRYAAPAVKSLAYVLENDSSKWARRAAARSLGKIGEPSAVQPLVRALRDDNKWVAHSAERALNKIRR